MTVRILPPSMGSLTYGVAKGPAGTLYVLAAGGGVVVEPKRGFEVRFGRWQPEPEEPQKPEVDGWFHVCIGLEDLYVSRIHGRITCYGNEWVIRNEGKSLIQFPDSEQLLVGHEKVLEPGHSVLFVKPDRQEHMVEVLVVGAIRSEERRPVPYAETLTRRRWQLGDTERVVLACLAQRYLRQMKYPQPMAWQAVAEELNELPDHNGWTDKKVANTVTDVRNRLREAGVKGLTREEVGEPVGNMLNHNLIQELLTSTTLTPIDLRAIGDLD